MSWSECLTAASVVLGLLSAASWLRASVVKVDTMSAVARRVEDAERGGEKASRASVSLDGWDMSATFSAQSKWNSLGAFFAALSISSQALSQVLGGA